MSKLKNSTITTVFGGSRVVVFYIFHTQHPARRGRQSVRGQHRGGARSVLVNTDYFIEVFITDSIIDWDRKQIVRTSPVTAAHRGDSEAFGIRELFLVYL